MPSQKPVLSVRVTEELEREIAAEIRRHNAHPLCEEWDTMKFLREAIREFLRKKRASRRRKSARKGGKAHAEEATPAADAG